MGKCRKRPRRSSAYPYSAIPVSSHIHIVRPKVRSDGTAPMFLGLFCDPTGMDIRREIIRRRSPGQLKRLGFVRTYSQYYWAKANQLMSTVYSNGRSYIVPEFFDSSVRGLEHRISDATLPLITAVQTKSIGVLASLDNQVNNAVQAAYNFISPKSAWSLDHAASMAVYEGRKKSYLQKMQKSVESLKTDGLSGVGKAAVENIRSLLKVAEKKDSDFAVQMIGEAWATLLSIPGVVKLLESAHPGVEFTRKKYLEAHDVIVASAYYTRTLDIAAGFVNRLQHTAMYRAASRLYPVISNYADPALDKITGSAYYSAVVDHLKPLPSGAPHDPSVSSGESKAFHILSCAPC